MRARGALLSFSCNPTVIWDGWAQLLGSLIASSQTYAICIVSGLACVKRQEKAGCQMPLSWISGWRGYTSEVLQGILRLTGGLMAFDMLLHFLFGTWTCLCVRETAGKSWGHLIVLLLIIWNRALAAVRYKVCCSPRTDTVRGVLRARWILGITAESSAPHATDHAARPLWKWDSIALWPARMRLCSSFFLSQVSYASLLHLSSLYLPFSRSNFIPPMRYGWRDCRGDCVPKPVIYRSSEGTAAAHVCAQWGWVFGASSIPPARNVALGWEPSPFAG